MPDLIEIPGFAELQALTRGDSRIKIAVLDGPADLDRACFQGGNISRVKGYWQQDLEPIDPFYIQQEVKINKLSDRKKALKKTLKQRKNESQDANATSDIEASQVLNAIAPSILSASHYSPRSITRIFNTVLEDTDAALQEQYRQLKVSKPQPNLNLEKPASFDTIEGLEDAIAQLEAEINALKDSIPQPVQDRLGGIFHATGIFGTMFGQPGSPVEGIAPYCTAINIPLFETATSDEALSPLNIAHAFNLALKLGVNIIHCAACHPNQTGFAHEMIQKAVKQCQDNNILIVAPSGNNKGEWFCAPAILPNVLAVGMMKDNGQPANYSNWGGQYQQQGILAPGENVIAAQPGTDEPARQEGTSLAAPVITGISALLMSVQLQRGEKPNAEAVRQALLNSAIPCDPEEVEEPERCLRGKLNIPGAYELITGEKLRSLSVADSPIDSSFSAKINSVITPIINGRYILNSQLIGTGITHIYEAIDVGNPATKVAFKVFKYNSDFPNFFQALEDKTLLNESFEKELSTESAKREREALTELKHPRIIKMLDSGVDEQTGDEFLVLELMKWNLADYLQAHPDTDWHYFYLNIALPILEGLEFCHRHHYIHRDIHPTNILLDNIGNIKLADFNISKKIDSKNNSDPDSMTCISLMKPGRGIYVPPEPDAGLYSYTRDVFGFGILVLNCLTNVELSNYEYVLEALEKLDAPLAAKKIIETTISLDPEKRPATAGVLLAEFKKIQNLEKTESIFVTESQKILNSNVAASATTLNELSSNTAATAMPHPSLMTVSEPTEGITPSAASKLVYALGTIGYDFGSEARRDTFKQLMPAVEIDGTTIPANPYDVRQMVNYLSQNPSEAKALIWTLNQELTPVYALEPRQGFSADIYEILIVMLAGQIEPEDSDNFVERVSIPAKTADKTVQLFSGQELPVITIVNTRGMYAWKINNLVEAALQSVASQIPQADEIALRKSLNSFLNKVYFEFQNLGNTSRDRALNFSVTNTFQAASSFAAVVSTGMQLDGIEVEKSKFCRLNSDCWDMILKFFDPENSRRAKKVYRFTVDVSDRIPVTLGQLRSWSVPK
ncbi:PatA/PatG family cyanobactin maturation protease [Microseira wollei]|uniref:Methyltransferase type 11 n=1 Tax=Microseira wollei NIES-4236 TaxID=2530354 RepID=A0AAV3XHK0_9CYAN|nr:PatA/PatG family cyanobactin maturation protease [Microseira wollei]GET40936.1 methyltransferase type 11 [Microseira wollei NIES-4236]